jgi:peptide-methionine (S)-S-oxide reductase
MTVEESIVLGGGCFWCIEAIYLRVKGVDKVTSGYAGGTTANPTYDKLHTHNTGHAEVIKVDFDPSIVTLDQILEIFWYVHDPTTLNQQGGDKGEQYRSIILYSSEDQLQTIQKSIDMVAIKLWDNPIVTEVKQLDKFYPAEDYHQNFFNKNPDQSYCQIVINPKLAKFETKFTDLLK